MTISFSYAYLKGLDRRIVSSPCVQIAVHRPSRAMSPRMTARRCEVLTSVFAGIGTDVLFMSTVSAMSSALWPVTM